MTAIDNGRMCLRDLRGRPKKYFSWTLHEISGQQTVPVQQVGHHIFILDRSGSMYSDIDPAKAMLEKILTLDEYRDSAMFVSLISFSSYGDVTTHFEHVPVSAVMAHNSPHIEQLRRIRATAMTGMTQALWSAHKIAAACDTSELCAITLVSDGYANDPSPTHESRELDKVIAAFQKLPNVFCNSVAFRSSADFKFLARLSNALSGTCTFAQDVKGVYDALYAGQKVLAGQTVPTIQIPLDGASYQVYLSTDLCTGGAADLSIRGAKADAQKLVYRFKEISNSTYDTLGENDDTLCRMVFARSLLAEGKLNLAKYALVDSRCETLLDKHARAITTEDIAAFASDLDAYVFCDPVFISRLSFSESYGLRNTGATVMEICALLDQYKGDILIDLEHLRANYHRRGLKRLLGTRDDKGVHTPPAFETTYTDKGDFAPCGGLEANRSSPTVNMMVIRPCVLTNAKTGEVVSEIAGIPIDLRDFKQYTIVSEGSINLPTLKLRINNKVLRRKLAEANAILQDNGDVVEIDLASKLLTRPDDVTLPTKQELNDLFVAVSFSKLIEALTKGQSAKYTPQQVEALKAHCLSANLYYNPGTCNPYVDRDAAIANGEIDSRVTYSCDFGTTDILNAGKLYSANELLTRHWEVSGVPDPKKAKWHEYWLPTFKAVPKAPGPRMKITAADDLMRSLYAEWLGEAPPVQIRKLLGSTAGSIVLAGDLGLDDDRVAKFMSIRGGNGLSDETTEILLDIAKRLDKAIQKFYDERIVPAAFQIGAGILPDALDDVQALTAEQLTQQLPNVPLSKDEKEATFFVVGDVVITVAAGVAWYSVEQKSVA